MKGKREKDKMLKRTAACFTLATFIASSSACMTWGTRRIQTTAPNPKQGAKIQSLVKRSGATVVFSAADPGRVVGNAIVGTAVGGAWESVEIAKPVPLVKRRDDGSVYEITDRDGRVHPVGLVQSEDADKMVIFIGATQPAPVSVPLAEIASVKIRRFGIVKTALALGGLFCVGFVTLMVIMSRE
jgi:hypothetical protein